MAIKDFKKVPTAEYISKPDQEYTAKLLAEVAQAEQMQQFISKVVGARASWMEQLKTRYKLNDGDSVLPDGKIIRQK